MALLARQSHRLALLASSQRAAASIHTTLPALAKGYSSPAPYSQPGPPSTASPEGLSKAAEFVISKVDDLMNWSRRGSTAVEGAHFTLISISMLLVLPENAHVVAPFPQSGTSSPLMAEDLEVATPSD